MSKGQWAFRPAALTRAIKAAEKAGKNVVEAEIDSISGKIELRFTASLDSVILGNSKQTWRSFRGGAILSKQSRMQAVSPFSASSMALVIMASAFLSPPNTK
jgi:hypothetical protein